MFLQKGHGITNPSQRGQGSVILLKNLARQVPYPNLIFSFSHYLVIPSETIGSALASVNCGRLIILHSQPGVPLLRRFTPGYQYFTANAVGFEQILYGVQEIYPSAALGD